MAGKQDKKGVVVIKNQKLDISDDCSALLDTGIINDTLILDTIMKYSQDTFYFKDRNSRFLFISKTVAARLGITNPDYVIGKTDFDLFLEPHSSEAFRDEQEIMRTGKPIIGKIERETWLDGTERWVSTSKYPLKNEDGEIIGTWGVSRDITMLKQAEEELKRVNRKLIAANRKLERISVTDSLSGLYNHRYFHEILSKEFGRKNRGQAMNYDSAVILMDIDNFKDINDSLGHLVGDLTIKKTAALIRNNIRAVDSAFRYGGDEFALMLTDTGKEGAAAAAEKLRSLVEQTPVTVKNLNINITISSGVGVLSEAKDMKELMRIVDMRLYESKKYGRNRITD